VPERLGPIFERADLDGDGTLSTYEEHLITGAAPTPPGDPLDGTWKVTVAGDAVPPVGSEFELVFKRGEEDKRSGQLESQDHKGSLRGLAYDAETQELKFTFTAGEVLLRFSAKLEGEQLAGTLAIEAGAFEAAFEAQREAPESDDKKSKTKKPKKAGPTFAEVCPKPMWITGLEASRHERGRIYLAVDGHRSDDDAPYAFVSEDEGVSWRSITAGLPRGSVRVLREDRVNENLLYLGTEFNAWISIDRGLSWTKVKGLPTVAIHEFAQSPATGDVVVGTHGRSLWAFDATTLRQFTAEALAEDAMLYAPSRVVRWRSVPNRAASGTRRFVGENPPDGAQIYYSLGSRVRDVKLSILGVGGQTVYTFGEDDVDRKSGLHGVTWNLRLAPSPEEQQSQGQGRRRFRGGRSVPDGTYQVVLEANGRRFTQPLVIVGDPEAAGDEESGEDEQQPEEREREYEMRPYEGDR
jgi:hypothetical protein